MQIKRAALYIRVSTDEQAKHGLSLNEQRNDLEQYARHNHYTIVGIYADEGTTARKTLKRRKQLQRLLDDVRADRIDIIITKDLERWMRSVRDFYHIQDILDEHHVGWECSQDRYNTTTANGKMQLNMRLAIAQDESDRDSERIRYVFEGKKRRHELLTGTIPPGFKAEGKHAVIDEAVAPLIRKVFYRVYHGGSVRSTLDFADEAQALGITMTYRKVRLWLVNKKYAGEAHGIPGYLPAIVPADVFQQVNDIIRAKTRPPRSDRIYLFSGLFHCPVCGSIMSANAGRPSPDGVYRAYQYRCSSHTGNRGLSCTFTRAIMEKKLESYLVSHMHTLISDHIYAINQERIRQERKRPTVTRESIAARLERLKDLYLDNLIEKEMYRKEFHKLNDQLASLAIPIQLPSVPDRLQQLADVTDFQSVYDDLTRENKKHFWKSIIKSITFRDTPETRGRGALIPFIVEFL